MSLVYYKSVCVFSLCKNFIPLNTSFMIDLSPGVVHDPPPSTTIVHIFFTRCEFLDFRKYLHSVTVHFTLCPLMLSVISSRGFHEVSSNHSVGISSTFCKEVCLLRCFSPIRGFVRCFFVKQRIVNWIRGTDRYSFSFSISYLQTTSVHAHYIHLIL